MAQNQDYKVLLLTSIPDLIDTITAVAREHLTHVESIYWEMGNKEAKPDVLNQIAASDYNLIISHISGIIIKRHHLDQAVFGVINIHPSPPAHPGCWGNWCPPVIRRDIRTHDGVTLHEIDEQIDHGPIYKVERWEVAEGSSIEDVMVKNLGKCIEMLSFAAKELAASSNGTKCFSRIDEQWAFANGHYTLSSIQEWFADLDPDHPAHQERVFLNHPKSMISPPYFSDLV
jgi:methionyl-tRNA formyltransferase